MAAFNRRYSLLLKKKILLQLLLLQTSTKPKKKNKKKCWVRKIYAERKEKGEFHLLVRDLKLHDHEYFFKCFRMSPENFEKLTSWCSPYLVKATTRMREPISPSERLCVTLRYLVTGDAQVTIGASYRMSPTTVGRIIKETCKVIWQVLHEKGFVSPPNTQKEWREIADEFEKKWNFPNALGALDGKHVIIQAPVKTASLYFNYKKIFSIVLLAICDANYRFILVDVGDTGRQSDGSVYNNSYLGHAIDNNLLSIPSLSKIKNSEKILPYVFIADDAFSLKTNMMEFYWLIENLIF